jgi:hypothetical protein
MRKPHKNIPVESTPKPLFLKQLSPQMIKLLEEHFWCDFSDINPALRWEKETPPN